MTKKLTEFELRKKLNCLVGVRFIDLTQLEAQLHSYFPFTEITLKRIRRQEADIDYHIIGTIKDKIILFDIDIWFVKDLKQRMLITETNGELQ